MSDKWKKKKKKKKKKNQKIPLQEPEIASQLPVEPDWTHVLEIVP